MSFYYFVSTRVGAEAFHALPTRIGYSLAGRFPNCFPHVFVFVIATGHQDAFKILRLKMLAQLSVGDKLRTFYGLGVKSFVKKRLFKEPFFALKGQGVWVKTRWSVAIS